MEADVLKISPLNRHARDQKLDILADITRAGFDNIDLVFLDTDDIGLRYEAIYQEQLHPWGSLGFSKVS
jgi:hypothetical protein